MKLWREDAKPINRDRGEGPPRCCNVGTVAGDELWWVGGLPPAMLDTMRIVEQAWLTIPDVDFYICGHCKQRLFSHLHITREDWMRGHGFGPKRIAAAWIHDEIFWRRGPSSAPPEVQAQSWWPQYQAFVTAADVARAKQDSPDLTTQGGQTSTTPDGVGSDVPVFEHPGEFRSAIDELLRSWDSVDDPTPAIDSTSV